jgi:ABC-type transporter Mla MlaB component
MSSSGPDSASSAGSSAGSAVGSPAGPDPAPSSAAPSPSLKWTCEQQGDELLLRLQGDLDENANLFEIKAVLSGRVRIDLGQVRRINSAGVRDWVNFIREVEQQTDHVVLADCSPAIVMQMNMISNFRGNAEVASIYAPLACPHCDHEQDGRIVLTDEVVGALPDHLPEFACDECGEALELDDIAERYFAFLRLAGTP